MVDAQADSNDYAGLGYCGIDYAPNLWMPLGFPMLFPLRENTSDCVEDKNSQYNSDNNDTLLATCSTFAQEEWQLNIFPLNSSTYYAMVNVGDGYALDIYAGHINGSGVGVVDLATANGTPAQQWFFASEAATPGGSVLIESGLNSGGSCLDLQGNYVNLLTPFDAYSCNSGSGNGNNNAQLFTPYIVGFPH
ncbi:MAG TPA: RICIN domain-containing protein [Polyangiaceae bacterium]